jgi:hypothetical protein
MSTLETFRPTDPITRAEMAKVVVTYTLDSSLQPPASIQNDNDTTASIQNDKCTAFSDLSTAPLDLQPFIIQACQLKLMGLQADGTTPKKTFDPNETITLAEVATTVSRLLR